MTGTNSSNDRLILRRNVEINSNWYFAYDVFSGIKSSTTWNGNVIAQSPRKMSELRDISNTSDIRFSMVYRTIIDVILHLFIICNDLRCQLPFFSQTFRHNGSAVFGTMPPMCRSCPDVNKLRGMDTTILGKHRPFMSIKSFVQHSGWQEMVSLCSLIRLIGVCADRDQPEFLCSRSDSRNLEVHVATAGGWLTRYRPREVRNSIYRYRKIHIDYRSKFLYRFISPISIIYGNTSFNHIECGRFLRDHAGFHEHNEPRVVLDKLWHDIINSHKVTKHACTFSCLPLATQYTTYIPSHYNNEQTTKQTKAINNSYIYKYLM